MAVGGLRLDIHATDIRRPDTWTTSTRVRRGEVAEEKAVILLLLQLRSVVSVQPSNYTQLTLQSAAINNLLAHLLPYTVRVCTIGSIYASLASIVCTAASLR